MGLDDSSTLAALKARRRKLIDPKIAEYGGRIVKTTGDGLLLEFPIVVDAVVVAADGRAHEDGIALVGIERAVGDIGNGKVLDDFPVIQFEVAQAVLPIRVAAIFAGVVYGVSFSQSTHSTGWLRR